MLWACIIHSSSASVLPGSFYLELLDQCVRAYFMNHVRDLKINDNDGGSTTTHHNREVLLFVASPHLLVAIYLLLVSFPTAPFARNEKKHRVVVTALVSTFTNNRSDNIR